MRLDAPAAVSFDVYSALIDSRRGASGILARLAEEKGWAVPGERLYDTWDALNKGLHHATREFVPFRVLARRAMATAFERLGIDGDPAAATDLLLSSVGTWEHYPDVPEAVGAVARQAPVAVLSNTDSEMLAATDLGYAFARAVISEEARSYKPHRQFYAHAEAQLGSPLVHVAASGRDVRGALEAGISVVRVVRPGHAIDPEGPSPPLEITDLRELPALLPHGRD